MSWEGKGGKSGKRLEVDVNNGDLNRIGSSIGRGTGTGAAKFSDGFSGGWTAGREV